MNTHLKQLWAAMKLPKNFKKSYKFFCLGLDIRVVEIMEEDRFMKEMEASFRHKFAGKPEVIDGNMKALKMAFKEVR